MPRADDTLVLRGKPHREQFSHLCLRNAQVEIDTRASLGQVAWSGRPGQLSKVLQKSAVHGEGLRTQILAAGAPTLLPALSTLLAADSSICASISLYVNEPFSQRHFQLSQSKFLRI